MSKIEVSANVVVLAYIFSPKQDSRYTIHSLNSFVNSCITAITLPEAAVQ